MVGVETTWELHPGVAHSYCYVLLVWSMHVLSVEKYDVVHTFGMGTRLGKGDTIPCNWKEIYSRYGLSATCIQHSKCIST